MKRKIKSNGGFTLIELIIAMAVLAFLMTAVCAFMGSSVASYKKSKADISVHNSAQETYDQITDSIMQASDIYVLGYISADGSDVLDFEISDRDAQGSVELKYFVRDEAQKIALEAMPEYVSGYPIEYFENVAAGSSIYVKELIIDTAVAIDMNYVGGYTPGATEFTNNLTGEADIEIVQATSKVGGVDTPVYSDAGNPVYNINDTLRNIYSFDSDNLYYERKYAFMTELNDYYNSADADDTLINYTYSSSFSFLNLPDGTTVSGCTIVVDAENGSIGLDLNFSDKNMTYTTLGMVNIRNSYVLKAKK
ncbi:MAG: type II secretion system protein [Lachnospiraceae bacterium]|nr:type II secretion system protein [Lachnospiraceae bacterium]